MKRQTKVCQRADFKFHLHAATRLKMAGEKLVAEPGDGLYVTVRQRDRAGRTARLERLVGTANFALRGAFENKHGHYRGRK
jgi:hypothetical protein